MTESLTYTIACSKKTLIKPTTLTYGIGTQWRTGTKKDKGTSLHSNSKDSVWSRGCLSTTAIVIELASARSARASRPVIRLAKSASAAKLAYR